ncbi:hypothetical protein CRU92_04000 [Arcobacter sp. FW59]|nr:hypothetical protein CRU92_04000 [Arcobacter sp. FW59]
MEKKELNNTKNLMNAMSFIVSSIGYIFFIKPIFGLENVDFYFFWTTLVLWLFFIILYETGRYKSSKIVFYIDKIFKKFLENKLAMTIILLGVPFLYITFID